MSLQKIQAELKANKSQYNKFGKFYYRSCEDILSAVKPLLAEYEYSLNITDHIDMVGDRYYVRATAKLFDDGGVCVAYAEASAREPLAKKGMDESQITGTASSYARKYALNGLFAIDDGEDSDSVEETEAKDIEEGKPRVPHKEMLAKFKQAMDESADVKMLKVQYEPAYKYFQKWDHKTYMANVHKHFKKLESTFNQPESVK